MEMPAGFIYSAATPRTKLVMTARMHKHLPPFNADRPIPTHFKDVLHPYPTWHTINSLSKTLYI